jgi:general secretion pathway protein B
MSFILDALKKSEIERQRQSIPGLVDAGVSRQRIGLPRWAIALCVLLGINLIVLLVVLIREGSHPPAAPTAQSAASAPVAPAPVAPAPEAPKPFSPLDNASTYAPEIPVPEPIPTAPPSENRAASHPPHHHDPVLKNEDYKADDDEVLPSINEINLTGAQALPELHLDVHVYATKSSDRFVFINMRKYHEGATLEEGPTIERIRRDGVILDYQGLRFLLPRQ